LFWKKSNKKSESSGKMFSSPDEVRGSFRVTPSQNAPLKATLNETPISIINISSGGFGFKKIDLKSEKFYLAEIALPLEKHKISALVKILEDTKEGYCRCQFLDLSQDYEDLIHRYVLNMQKKEQEIKKRSLS
jgi:hypothetical protein